MRHIGAALVAAALVAPVALTLTKVKLYPRRAELTYLSPGVWGGSDAHAPAAILLAPNLISARFNMARALDSNRLADPFASEDVREAKVFSIDAAFCIRIAKLADYIVPYIPVADLQAGRFITLAGLLPLATLKRMIGEYDRS